MRKVLHVFFVFYSFVSFSQDVVQSNKFKTTSFLSGYGFGENTDSKYRPLYFMADFAKAFNNRTAGKKMFLTWYLEPQINLIFTERPLDFEVGTNIGLRNHIKFSDNFYFYQMIGSGPHYYSAKVSRQAPGFLFSDNWAIGTYNRISKANSLFLNLQLRFRHMSNASLKKPNGGINTFNFLVGIMKQK
jgi:hypothetical protein